MRLDGQRHPFVWNAVRPVVVLIASYVILLCAFSLSLIPLCNLLPSAVRLPIYVPLRNLTDPELSADIVSPRGIDRCVHYAIGICVVNALYILLTFCALCSGNAERTPGYLSAFKRFRHACCSTFILLGLSVGGGCSAWPQNALLGLVALGVGIGTETRYQTACYIAAVAITALGLEHVLAADRGAGIAFIIALIACSVRVVCWKVLSFGERREVHTPASAPAEEQKNAQGNDPIIERSVLSHETLECTQLWAYSLIDFVFVACFAVMTGPHA